ncbi:hypothetical protein NUW58_g7293 [Xylaria curta]|uniref:Uncharacterized protein n=1 Tax=Xylaria curta TaxID=42375 RepID=A0ACC1NL66_9PEZI|nr:hypothetical protein NUW58_g7293 [Xylaria curta]
MQDGNTLEVHQEHLNIKIDWEKLATRAGYVDGAAAKMFWKELLNSHAYTEARSATQTPNVNTSHRRINVRVVDYTGDKVKEEDNDEYGVV